MFSQKVLARLILGSFAALALANPALAEPAGDPVEVGGGVPSGQAWFDVLDVKSSRTKALSLATLGRVRSVQGGNSSSILTVTSPVEYEWIGHPQGIVSVDFALSEEVSLDGVSFVAFDAFNWDISTSGSFDAQARWQLLYQGQALTEEAVAFTIISGTPSLRIVVRWARFLSEMDPGTMADGVRLLFEYEGTGTFTTELSSINQDDALNWRFASCAFSLQGPHRRLLLHDCLDVIQWSMAEPSDWQVREFDEPVSTNNLRYALTGGFWSQYSGNVPHGTIEMQLLLSDESGDVTLEVTLDDWNSPSMLEPPNFNLVNGAFSLFLDDATQDELEGLWITGIRWRVHLAAGSSGVTVTPNDPFGFAFLYDVPVCSSCPGCSSCFSDLNGDGEVGPFDLALLLGNWGACASCSDCFADLNGGGMVGPSDLAILLGDWGACP